MLPYKNKYFRTVDTEILVLGMIFQKSTSDNFCQTLIALLNFLL